MSRYRKISPRIWYDEAFRAMSPGEKMAWLLLLTHPSMTPMGAGVVPLSEIDAAIGNSRGWCHRCGADCTDHSHTAEGILNGFSKRMAERMAIPSPDCTPVLCDKPSLILYKDGLVIVRRYLLYNHPDNQNTLANWIESCEELPCSTLFTELRDYLLTCYDESGAPLVKDWVFSGLLNPLAEQKNHGLKTSFWSRVACDVKPPNRRGKNGQKRGRIRNVLPNVPPNVPPNVSTNVSPNVTHRVWSNQEQEQEQDIDRYSSSGHNAVTDASADAEGDTSLQLALNEELADPKPAGKNGRPSNGTSTKPDYSAGFEEFWAVYPKKVNKAEAKSAWMSAAKKHEIPDIAFVVNRIRAMSDTDQWADRQYIPYPSTFINRRSWDNDPELLNVGRSGNGVSCSTPEPF